jgi:hypothetical protein
VLWFGISLRRRHRGDSARVEKHERKRAAPVDVTPAVAGAMRPVAVPDERATPAPDADDGDTDPAASDDESAAEAPVADGERDTARAEVVEQASPDADDETPTVEETPAAEDATRSEAPDSEQTADDEQAANERFLVESRTRERR